MAKRNPKERKRCLACDEPLDITEKVDLGHLPFYYGVKNPKLEPLLSGKRLKAQLVTCWSCGLTQQILYKENLEMVEAVYKSQSSDASTPMADSGWGQQRTKGFFDNTKFLFAPTTVLEIGCQSGYLLYALFKQGAKKLIGVEPSRQVPYQKNGFKAKVYTEFFDEKRFKGQTFDTVISLWVLEHVKAPVDFLKSLAAVLSPKGQLIIAVPNAERQMKVGDPGFFMHEHLSHFTRQSLRSIFSLAGLRIEKIKETRSDFYVTARKSAVLSKRIKDLKRADPLSVYRHSLQTLLKNFKERRMSAKRLGLWGACATAANLISLTNLKRYTIFDGDVKKQGKEISGILGVVNAPTQETLQSLVDKVCVIPIGFQDVIGKILAEYAFPYFSLVNKR